MRMNAGELSHKAALKLHTGERARNPSVEDFVLLGKLGFLLKR
jgi:hypothetical protein